MKKSEEEAAARLKAMEDEQKEQAAAWEKEEMENLAQEAADAKISEEGTPTAPKPRGNRRPSVIVNQIEDSDDDDDESNLSECAPETVSASAVEVVAPAAPSSPAASPAAVAAPAPVAPVVKKSAAAVKNAKLEAVAQNNSDAIEDMILSDELLEQCFTNLNGGVREGSLNPMKMSILVRLITKKHDLMQEMKWFAKFDVDGVGGVDINEFKAGFRSIEVTTALIYAYTVVCLGVDIYACIHYCLLCACVKDVEIFAFV